MVPFHRVFVTGISVPKRYFHRDTTPFLRKYPEPIIKRTLTGGRCEDLKLVRFLIRTTLRHENRRSFLFSRLDQVNRTDPEEVVRNVEYMM